MSEALALIRVCRWNDPWGRDVIEATRAGVPVLATGMKSGVIDHGKTGFLFEPFSAKDMAQVLVRLATDQAFWKSISDAAILKGEQQFSGLRQASQVAVIFERLIKENTVQTSDDEYVR